MTPDEMYDWWNGAAHANALNAILSSSSEWDVQAFFATGRDWIHEQFAFAAAAGAHLRGESALDFGCGVGRMTHALTASFDRVEGVDISDEMVRLAEEHGNLNGRITFTQVRGLPLPFGSACFDLVYSTIVVQHIPMPYSAGYIDEFFRVARQWVLFDAPSHTTDGREPQASDGIFLIHRDLVFNRASVNNFELLAMRSFPATSTRHYQYLFQRAH